MAELTVKRRARDLQEQPEELAVEVSSNSKGQPYKRQVEAVRTSWLLRDAKEIEIREFFRELPLSEGMSQLASARKNIELAAEVLNQRIGEEAASEVCSTCGGPSKRKDGLWIQQGVRRDPDTGILIPYRFCDVFCLREYNRKMLMPAGASPVAADGTEMGDIR